MGAPRTVRCGRFYPFRRQRARRPAIPRTPSLPGWPAVLEAREGVPGPTRRTYESSRQRVAPIVPDPKTIKSVRTEAAFEAWMRAHHVRETEVWLRVHTIGSIA
jgi:hypothetical protein